MEVRKAIKEFIAEKKKVTMIGRPLNEDRLFKAYKFIEKHIEKYGYPPTRLEIAKSAGMKYSSNGRNIVVQLVRIGLLYEAKGKGRAISLREDKEHV